MDNNIKLSVVIATFNGSQWISRCLESFTIQSFDDRNFEVIVVNNNSKDQTGKLVTEFIGDKNNFFLVDELQQGVSFARNKGITVARGKYICFIDDDAYADPHWLERIYHAFKTVEPNPVVIGGKILPYYVSNKPTWFKDTFETRTKGERPMFLSKKNAFFGFPESNYSVRKDILDEIGLFSTSFGPKGEKMHFGEGSDLSRRIASKYPYFWYDPEIFVYHLVPEKNMSVKYILQRKYTTARLYQSFDSQNSGFFRDLFIFSTCVARIIASLILSIILVRWYNKNRITDWLKHMITVVNCTARSKYLLEKTFRLNKSTNSNSWIFKLPNSN